MSLSACAQMASVPAANQPFASETLVGSTWVVAGSALPPDARPRIAFASATNAVGHGGCNRFTATSQLAGSRFKVGPIATTKIFCPEAGSAEQTFFQALESARRARMDGAELVLQDDSGQEVLRLARG